MGIELDEKLNASVRAKEVIISKPSSKVKVVIIPLMRSLQSLETHWKSFKIKLKQNKYRPVRSPQGRCFSI